MKPVEDTRPMGVLLEGGSRYFGNSQVRYQLQRRKRWLGALSSCGRESSGWPVLGEWSLLRVLTFSGESGSVSLVGYVMGALLGYILNDVRSEKFSRWSPTVAFYFEIQAGSQSQASPIEA